MTAVKIIKFDPKHLDLMEIRPLELHGVFELADACDRMARVAKASIQAVTFLFDGRVLCCAGFHELWPGVLEVWMIPSIYVKRLPISFPRMIRRYLDNIFEDFGAHRVQTTSHDDPFHARWMEWLGFKNETPEGMRKFTYDKQTMCIYSRVK